MLEGISEGWYVTGGRTSANWQLTREINTGSLHGRSVCWLFERWT